MNILLALIGLLRQKRLVQVGLLGQIELALTGLLKTNITFANGFTWMGITKRNRVT